MKTLRKDGLPKKFLKLGIVLLYVLIGTMGFPESGDFVGFKDLIFDYYIIGFLFIFLILFFSVNSLRKAFKEYFYNIRKYSWYTIKYFIMLLICFAIFRIVSLLFTSITPSGTNLINITMEVFPVYVFFVTVLYIPLVEGVIFRKYLHDVIKNKYIFILLSSIFYGFLHIIGDYSNMKEFIALFLPLWSIGIVLAYSYTKTKNIFVSIFCHLLYNFFVLIPMFMGTFTIF